MAWTVAQRGSTRPGALCSSRWQRSLHRPSGGAPLWHPAMALPVAEQKSAARPRQARTFFVLLRAHRHAWLDATCQATLAETSRAAPGGTAPVAAGGLARAPLVPAAGHGGARDAVARTVLAKRGQRGLDGLGAAPPPCSPGPRWHLRRRLLAHSLDTSWLERTVPGAEQTGGCGARPLRAALASTPLST